MEARPDPSSQLSSRRSKKPLVALLCAATVAVAVAALHTGCDDGRELAAGGVGWAPAAVSGVVQSTDCRSCHLDIYEAWRQSHHAAANRLVTRRDRAMFSSIAVPGGAAVAMPGGRPQVRLQSEHGHEWFAVDMVLAHTPLRQALIPWADGGWQVSQLAWDPERGDWFDVYEDGRQPGEWGSWTGRAMSWNASCAACHMTGFRKNYDPATDRYDSQWTEQGVGCIQCHPAQDAALPDRTPFCTATAPLHQLDNCAACHSRRADFDGGFRPGDRYDDHHLVQLPTQEGLYHADGQIRDEVYVWTSFQLSKMGHAGVSCMDCHDPHTYATVLPFDNNALCMRCHTAPGLDGAPVIAPTGHSHHAEGSTGNRCVNCHMPETTYMQRDPRRDHGFLSPDPRLTATMGIPNACARCHSGQDPQAGAYDTAALADVAEQWWGPQMNAATRQRARALGPAYTGALRDGQPLLHLLADETNPYWQATYLELLHPWANAPAVREAAQRHTTAAEPRLRAAAYSLLADTPQAADALADPSRSVRRAVAIVRPDLLPTHPAAHAELNEELRYNSDQPLGAVAVAVRHELNQQPAEAAQWFQRAIRYDPNSAPIIQAYALFLGRQGRLQEALQQLDNAVRLADTDPSIHYHRALALAEAGNAHEAELSLHRVVELDPHHARAYYNLGLLLAQRGAMNEAIATLRKAEQAAPAEASFPYARATLHLRQDDPEAARQAAHQALLANPSYIPALQLLQQLDR